MIDLASVPLALSLPVSFAGGLIVGLGYFLALRATADLLVRGNRPLLGLALTFGRLACIVAAFYVAVLAGAFALLAALAGVLCAKAIVVRQTRGTP